MNSKRESFFRFASLSAAFLALSASPNLAKASGHFFAPDDQFGALWWQDTRCWYENVVGNNDVVFRSLPYDTNWVYLNGGAGMGNLSILRGDWKFGAAVNSAMFIGGNLVVGDVSHPESVPGYTKAYMTFDYYAKELSPGYTPNGSCGGIQVGDTTYIGKSAGSEGTLNLLDNSSEAALSTNTLIVGYHGTGTLNVRHSSVEYGTLSAGAFAGSQGDIVADGEPSIVYHDFVYGTLLTYSLSVKYPDYFHPNQYGSTDIGGSGTGTLTLKNGATGKLGWLTGGSVPGGSGSISLLNGSYANAHRVDLGFGGEAHLTMDNSTLEVLLNPYHPHAFPGEGNFRVSGSGGPATVSLLKSVLDVRESVSVQENATFEANGKSVVKVGGGTFLPGFEVKASAGKTASAMFDDSKLEVPNGGLWIGSGAQANYPDSYGLVSFTARNGSSIDAKYLVAAGGGMILQGVGTELHVSQAGIIGDPDGNYTGTLGVESGAKAYFGSMLKTGTFGTVSVLGGGAITVGLPFSSTGVGHIQVSDGGVLGGRGTFLGDVDVNGGTIDPGFSPGIMHVVGDFTMNSGTLVLEVGGFTPGAEYDQLDVSGLLTINGGTIDIEAYNGWSLPLGATFDFFHFGGLSIGPGVTILNNTGTQFVFDPTTGSGTVTAVPEPASLAAFAIGGIGLLARKRRR